MANIKQDTLPVIRDLRDFDPRSGNVLERMVFNYRPLFMLFMCWSRGVGVPGADPP